jgi:alpha-N-arabinofuranosidase
MLESGMTIVIPPLAPALKFDNQLAKLLLPMKNKSISPVHFFGCAFAALILQSLSLPAADLPMPKMEIDLSQPGVKVSPAFYGLMTEEINHSYDGGLYAELIQNRSFKDDTNSPVHWSLVAAGDGNSIALDETQPVNAALTTCLKLEVGNASNGRVGIANEGFWGIPAAPKTTYRASFFAKANNDSAGPLTLSLESADGTTVYATAQVPKITGQWKRYSVKLTTKKIKPVNDARFVVSTAKPGTYWFNLVSLFPPTWKDRPNGNRVDLMQRLVDLKPKFLRFPGGNYLEGKTMETHFPWKETLGDISQRPGHSGTWGYRSSDGMGLLEFLEWAEDMGAEPVLAVYAGYSLPSDEHPKGITVQAGHDLEPFVQEALDEIEYVSGEVNTKWGARRAADGHPAPFPLHYVEIGNEDFIGDAKLTYDARFAQFYDAIKAAHPQLQCIATIPVKGRVPEVIDDHYYATSGEMMKLAHKSDHYDRSKPKIFVGEWATREITQVEPDRTVKYNWMPWEYKNSPTPDLHAALGDAAFMTGMERNSDIIVMNGYAPLLTRIEPGAFQWNPNLIGYDSLRSYGSPSYYAQQMFNLHRGDTMVPTRMMAEPAKFFYSVTRDSAKGIIYLKVVNLNSTAQTMQFELKGATEVAGKGLLTVLTSAKPDDTNTINDPEQVMPVTTKIKGLGTSFTYTFAPYSINVLQLEAK